MTAADLRRLLDGMRLVEPVMIEDLLEIKRLVRCAAGEGVLVDVVLRGGFVRVELWLDPVGRHRVACNLAISDG